MLNYEIYNDDLAIPIHIPLWRPGNQTGRQFLKKMKSKVSGDNLGQKAQNNAVINYLYNVSYEYQLKDWKLYSEKQITMGKDRSNEKKDGNKKGIQSSKVGGNEIKSIEFREGKSLSYVKKQTLYY